MPYWRLSSFYFCYFASLGALVPYLGLYLADQGYSAAQIGQLMAIIILTKVIAPGLWGWLADRRRQHMLVVRIASSLAFITFAGVLFSTDFMMLVVVMLVFSFFWHAVLPQVEANTLAHLGDAVHRYGRIRLWGSIGFIVSVLGLGMVLDYGGVVLLPVIALIIMFTIAVMAFFTPESEWQEEVYAPLSLLKIVRQPQVIALLVVCFLMQLSHGPYYTFYSIYLTQHGYSSTLIGWLWALGVIAEVFIFLIMYRLIPRYGLRNLLLFALVVTAIRWLGIGYYGDNIIMLHLMQLIHAASYGIFHAVAVQYLFHFFPRYMQGRGQALYGSISFGAGGAIGSLYSGLLWSDYGGATFFIAALIALIAALIGYKFLPQNLHALRNRG